MKSRNENSKPRIYNRLFLRIYLYFGIILVLFAVLLGVIFMKLYEQNTMESHRISLEQQAERIAGKISGFLIKNDKKGYDAYHDALQSIEDSNTTEVWIVASWLSDYPMGKSFTNTNLTPEDAGKRKGVLEAAFRGKEAYLSGYDDIYEMPTLWVAQPVHDAGGNVVGAVMIASMIQSQKRIIDSSKSTIVISAIFAMLISIIIALLFAGEIAKPISGMRRTALRLAEGRYDTRTKIKRKDEIGDLARSLDILAGRLKENEKAREDMEQMRRDFFSNVSHELRTPITVLRGYAEMLADGVIEDEADKEQYYGRMKSECQSMERLVGDLLILSRLQNPDFEIEKEPVNLIQIFDDIVRGMHVIAEKKQVKIHFLSDGDFCMMMGDYDRLRQMFTIILDNAIKFSNEGGEIHIKVTSMDKLMVSISDEGIGITEEELPFIFEKFYKSKLRQNAQGSGLGLVIAKQIALRHNGTIKVESEPGKGTAFYFCFDKIDMKMI